MTASPPPADLQGLREGGRRGAPCRIEVERTVDGGQEPSRQVGPGRHERGRTSLDRTRRLEQRRLPEGMPPGERLPEEHADGPDVCGRRRRGATEAFRRDVRERPRDVAHGRQRLGLRQTREPEVEQAHGHTIAVGEQHVRRLHVAVDDAARVRVREPL